VKAQSVATWTLAFDFAAALSRLKPEKRTLLFTGRADRELSFILDPQTAGPPILLDTTVYIDVLQRRAPPELGALLAARQVNHSSVAVCELSYLFGRLDPAHRGTKAVLAGIRATIDDIPHHRLSARSVQAMVEAGIVTGKIARLRGLAKTDRQPLLNDASLYLQALESGAVLVSRNVSNMDLLQQIPGGRLLLYRRLT
jgi:predicted nucleic acid-binding protein